MATIKVELQTSQVTRSKFQPETNFYCESGDQVYIYEEKYEMLRSGEVVRVHAKELTVNNGIKMQTLVKTQAIQSSESNYDRDLKRLLSGISKYAQVYIPGVLMTKTTDPSDPRADSKDFMNTIYKELKGLIEHKCFKDASLATRARNESILSSRFDVILKNFGTDNEQQNRLVVN